MLGFFISLLFGVSSLIITIVELRQKESDKKKVAFGIGVAVIALVYQLFVFKISAPYIERTTDYSAVTIKSDDSSHIEYRISTNGENSDQWIRYKEPF